MNEKELREFRERFGVPISDEEVAQTPFYRPPLDSPETKYLLERRKALGGFLPARVVRAPKIEIPARNEFDDDGVRATAQHVVAQQQNWEAYRADHP